VFALVGKFVHACLCVLSHVPTSATRLLMSHVPTNCMVVFFQHFCSMREAILCSYQQVQMPMLSLSMGN